MNTIHDDALKPQTEIEKPKDIFADRFKAHLSPLSPLIKTRGEGMIVRVNRNKIEDTQAGKSFSL